ncbi:diaminopimelate decarboxylase [Candidatus Micrarchaeota archaeon]|nr:diaminopimelate decarboxylase [Candidatus Micrarchaeota archaeon]
MWKIEKPLENRDGLLFMGGISCTELAEKYGTPLYATDETRIRENYGRMVSAFSKHYKKFRLYYAIKANNNLAILNILRQEGSGADCSCPAELFLAKKAGFKTDDLLYTGNYNSDGEFKYACEMSVKINLDDWTYIDRLVKFASPPNIPPVICFRFNPGVGKSDFGLVFSGPDAKFGITADKIVEAYRKAKEHGFKRFGIHMMTGSCVRDPAYFEQVAGMLFDIAGRISEGLGISFDFVNIGGGFGVPYKLGENDLDIEETGKRVATKFKEKIEEKNMGEPYLFIEPGRFIVCDSTILLTRVHAIKKTAEKKFVGVDAGMNTLLRPALYNAYHQMFVANKLSEIRTETVNVVGPICENTDQLAKDRELPIIEEGDVIAILNAGAYGFSMSSQYNTRPRAAEVLVNNGKSEVIRERESFGDLISKVRVPERLLK